jgi:hypothetical protein
MAEAPTTSSDVSESGADTVPMSVEILMHLGMDRAHAEHYMAIAEGRSGGCLHPGPVKRREQKSR